MGIEQYDVVKRQLECKFACLLACGCDLLFEAADLLATLPRADRDLLYYELCSTGCTIVQPGPGPGPGPNPDPGGGAQMHQCTQKVVDAVCTANRKVQMVLLRTYILAIKNLMGGDSTGVLDTFVALLDQLLGFCNNPDGGNVDQFVTDVCKKWTSVQSQLAAIRAMFDLLGGPGQTAKGIFDGIFNLQGPLSLALNECCGVVGTALGPDGSVVAANPPSSTSTTPVSTIRRPIRAPQPRFAVMPRYK